MLLKVKAPLKVLEIIFRNLLPRTTALITSGGVAPMVLVEETAHYHIVKDAIDSAEMDLTLGMAVLKTQIACSSTQNSANSLSEIEFV